MIGELLLKSYEMIPLNLRDCPERKKLNKKVREKINIIRYKG